MRRRDRRKAWVSVLIPMTELASLIILTWPLEAVCVVLSVLGFFGALVVGSWIYALWMKER